MKIGCFALVEPFTPMDRQFELIRSMGIDYVDLTDNHDGASLGAEFGFAASISLDSNPAKIRRLAARHKLKLSTVCAHANLLDPAAPDVYGTFQIIKAIRLAADLGIPEVITTEGDPKTEFGHRLTDKERLFTICEKLQSPIEWAEELGVKLLLEPHGIVTDSVKRMGDLLGLLGHEKTVNTSWAGEVALDVEWAHAIAPGAHILLVEAASDATSDLLTAIDYARRQTGVVAVSMSWGGDDKNSSSVP